MSSTNTTRQQEFFFQQQTPLQQGAERLCALIKKLEEEIDANILTAQEQRQRIFALGKELQAFGYYSSKNSKGLMNPFKEVQRINTSGYSDDPKVELWEYLKGDLHIVRYFLQTYMIDASPLSLEDAWEERRKDSQEANQICLKVIDGTMKVEEAARKIMQSR